MCRMELLAERVKSRAFAIGFDLVGVAAVSPPVRGNAFQTWLNQGYHGDMAYLPRTAEQRLHPERFLSWAKSIIAVGLCYWSAEQHQNSGTGLRGRIARYAQNKDYHEVLGKRLDQLWAAVCEEAGRDVQARAFVDAGPILDREIASAAGLAWYGKNTNLIRPGVGSYFVLGELFLDIVLEADSPLPNRCGDCRLCLDACPTDAFVGPYILDARKCISYLTIELKGPIPTDLREPMGSHLFGCDICQDVCPYNIKPLASTEAAFSPRPDLQAPELIPFLSLTEHDFKVLFRESPALRAKRRGFLRNVCVALGNSGQLEAVPALANTLRHDRDALVRAHAAWALGRIAGEGATSVLREVQAKEEDPVVLEEIAQAVRACDVHHPQRNAQ
ncbi:MAG TPA: tRNA epoxyqueuosine(34) reductase QueG [Candidatus Baltobacteraceae bacterium]|nr:tRNA epoxyqueuosine(34) reductase QueG [Candidatus Baltobacteraceae bacterium]